MRKGEPGDRMYVLIKGRLGIYIDDSPYGLASDPIAVIEKFKAVGERALKHKDDRRSATVMCLDVGETVCLTLEKDDYKKLVYVSDPFFIEFYRDKYKFQKVTDLLF
jgi:signal-transduction protein with cAMP-binding, CBS, and nucleotidyltransferase domain